MMRGRKNRRKQSEGFIFPAPFAAILGLVAVISLSYLWLCGRCEAIGSRIKQLEDRKIERHKQVINEEYKWANMKSPATVEAMLKKFNLAMAWPEKDQVVRLRTQAPGSETLRVADETRTFAQRKGATVVHD
jgi:hypothetical protein